MTPVKRLERILSGSAIVAAVVWTCAAFHPPPVLAGAGAFTSPSTTVDDARSDTAARDPLPLRVRPLPKGVRRVSLQADGQGGHWIVLQKTDGGTERIRPAEFSDRIYRDHHDRPFAWRMLNVTGPAGIVWVALGLLGQCLFAGRMMVQWIVSEKSRRSVVPVAFWWISIAGATMLLLYFIWRKDIVGVLGQSTGWLIYARNLRLIHRDPARATAPFRSPGDAVQP